MSIGDIYLDRNSYSEPEIIKIVGFTPSGKSVRCAYVPCKNVEISFGCGGTCQIDVDAPVGKGYDLVGRLHDKGESTEYISAKQQRFFKVDKSEYDHVWSWCEY